MKKVFLSLFVAMMALVAVKAQQIAVVSKTGSTSVYQTLKEAIEGASDGSVIYLPGGGFQIADDVIITKPLSIIGIGHKTKNENVDGNTTISGNVNFGKDSSGSAIMGCYISGNIEIGKGDDTGAVNNIMIKYCNVNAINVGRNDCTGLLVNQNYIRRSSNFGGSSVTLSNNIIYTFEGISGGVIVNNIVTNTYYLHVISASNSTISYNVFFNCMGGASNNGFCAGGNNQGTDNIYPYKNNGYAQFDNKIILDENVGWGDVFVKYSGITPNSDFHFTKDYVQYEHIGIYGGTGFSDGALPPVPFIVSKSIPEQTDASGKLNIKIRVKAGE